MPCEDSRLDANANRLRQCQDVSLLNWKSSGPSDFLYEAQMSCLVAGEDESRWVAYGFIDTYFDAINQAKETVKAYHEDAITEGGINADPLTFGAIDAEKTIQTPREYFLTVLQIRIAQVTREWEQVVAKVEQSIREYEQVSRLFISFQTTELGNVNPHEAVVYEIDIERNDLRLASIAGI